MEQVSVFTMGICLGKSRGNGHSSQEQQNNIKRFNSSVRMILSENVSYIHT